MTRDDILRMAREAWGDSDPSVDSPAWRDNMARFAALVAAAEREACAKVCFQQRARWPDDRSRYVAAECAAAIRARSKE